MSRMYLVEQYSVRTLKKNDNHYYVHLPSPTPTVSSSLLPYLSLICSVATLSCCSSDALAIERGECSGGGGRWWCGECRLVADDPPPTTPLPAGWRGLSNTVVAAVVTVVREEEEEGGAYLSEGGARRGVEENCNLD